MAPEIKMFIDPKDMDDFRAFVQSHPGTKIRSEGLDTDEFSTRLLGVFATLNQDEVRIIDLDRSKTRQAQNTRAQLWVKDRKPPAPWEEFYRGLDNLEQALIGQVIRPLVEGRFGPYTLSAIQAQPLDIRLFRTEPSRQVAQKAFGIKFKTD